MAPVKFDDISKPTADLFNEDYQTNGFQFKSKQKSSLKGAVATTTVDLWGGKDCQTAAKLSWKFPSICGVAGVSVDKLEMDKAGKFKMEVSGDRSFHKIADVKMETKSDLIDPSKATFGLTYTGIKNCQMKFETKVLNPVDFQVEFTQAVDKFTFGGKCTLDSIQAPDLGVRVAYGPVVASLLAKNKFSNLCVHACVAARSDLKVAGFYQHAKKVNYGLGLAYSVDACRSLIKAKVDQDGAVSGSIKHDLVKGFTLLGGGTFNACTGNVTYGLQLSIE